MPRLTGNRCQCPTCGEFFNGTQPFDKHRVGQYAQPGERHNTRRCLTVPEMEAAGFQRNAAGFWCERAKEPHPRPRAPVISPRRARSVRVSLHPSPHAQEHRLRKAGAK